MVVRSIEGQAAHLVVDAVPQADIILIFSGVILPPRPRHPYPDLGGQPNGTGTQRGFNTPAKRPR